MRANTLLALGRLKPGQMNKTETAYRDHLRALKAAGEVLDFRFEAITLKLAQDLRYTPDFFVLKPDGSIEFHEVKGSRAIFRDDAKAKCKMCAQLNQWATLIVVYPRRKKDGGGWKYETFEPSNLW